MIVVVKNSFLKDIAKIKDKKLSYRIQETLQQFERTANIKDIKNSKKIIGESNAYRIRIGDYRLGFYLNNHAIELIAFAHRKEIYRYFP